MIYPLIVILCWILALILPHFQSTPSAADLVIDTSVVALLGLYGFKALNSRLSTSSILKKFFVSVSAGGFAICFIFSKLSCLLPYEIWSHLGAGTMKLNESIYIFGDLAHLTSAADCKRTIDIGANVCDPWGRPFNQNPDIGNLFKAFHFSNVNVVGVITTICFFLVFFYVVRFFRVNGIGPYLVLATPVFILALDRGNEITTITLLLVGIMALNNSQNTPQFLGALVLSIAVLLKLWPIMFVAFYLVFNWSKLKLHARVLLLIAFIYWGFKIREVGAILDVTQSGSPFGTSFGLRLFANPQLNVIQISMLICITLIFTAALIKFGNSSLVEPMQLHPDKDVIRLTSPLMLTYSAIWATGDNFMYRMVILLPLVIILSSKEISEFKWSKILVAVILVALITSRLPITLAVSSALALFFVYIVTRLLLNNSFLFRQG